MRRSTTRLLVALAAATCTLAGCSSDDGPAAVDTTVVDTTLPPGDGDDPVELAPTCCSS